VNELTKKILGTYQLFNIIAANEPKLKRHSILYE